MTRIATILIGLNLLISCDCYRLVTGKVIDKKTERPINFATITILGVNNSTTTDSLGNFHFNIIENGLQCYCMANKKINISSPFYLTDTFTLSGTPFRLKADTNHIKKFFEPTNDFMSKWTFFNLKDTIKFKIIYHIRASVDCGTLASASITIGITQTRDTIRVLELCNTKKDFKKDDLVIVVPAKKPDFQVTHTRVFIQGTQGPLKPDIYDTQVLRTTYGTLLYNQ